MTYPVCKSFALCFRCGHVSEIPPGHVPVRCASCSGTLFAVPQAQRTPGDATLTAMGEMSATLDGINETIRESVGILSRMADSMAEMTQAVRTRQGL